MADVPREFDVFISFKDKDASGHPTPDSRLALECHEYLTSRGLEVFCSAVTLERLGVAAYQRAIDEALDQAKVLIAVGCSAENLDSQWVRYEWSSFFNDMLSGTKPEGRIFVYLAGGDPKSLPRTLRQTQVVMHGPGGLEQLHRFVANSFDFGPPPAGRPVAAPLGRGGATEGAAPPIALSAAGAAPAPRDHRSTVADLTRKVQQLRQSGDLPGQGTALLELAGVVSEMPGQLGAALKLVKRSRLIGLNNGLSRLEADSATLLATLRQRMETGQGSALANWIGRLADEATVLGAEWGAVGPVPAGSREREDRAGELRAMEGAWEWVATEGPAIAVEFHARIIDGMLWVPYSWGSAGTLSALFFAFRPSAGGWMARFQWKDMDNRGVGYWRLVSPDCIRVEWWYDSQLGDASPDRPPRTPGNQMTLNRLAASGCPAWADQVFEAVRKETDLSLKRPRGKGGVELLDDAD